MSQPAPGPPIGRQSSGYSATPLTHPTHVSHSQRSEAHRRAIQTRWQHGRGLVCHIRACVPHHQEAQATTSHRCMAARRHRGLTAPSQPPSGNSTTPFFKHCSSHRDHVRVAQPPPSSSSPSLRLGTPQRHSGRRAHQPLLLPRSGTSPHPLDCV